MKKHPIPLLDEEKWKDVQDHLYHLSKIVNKIETITDQKEIKCLAEELSIHLGLIDVVLGRVYSLKELIDEMEKIKEVKKSNGKEK